MGTRPLFRAACFSICAAALMALAACGDGTSSKGANNAPSGSVSEVVLLRGNGGDPASLDPHFVTAANEDAVISDMLIGLTTQDAEGRAIPGAAERWDTSPDGKTWTFHLRDHQWSDGMPVTDHFSAPVFTSCPVMKQPPGVALPQPVMPWTRVSLTMNGPPE